ncbi:BspA family leucine-rich repeat surface protein [Mycoplasma capricolum]|uniref:PARCEL domain membrane protein n=1 Tax=Mycoplasma capricolum subsp. capricolum TaxID=40479 RepID=A0A0C3A0W4_MYCCA|nr:BspA family leucine-rich repeat surface protein [Mycoplasma capricolum]KIM13944.1 PARCEL domain membrane protein [Mycoplasma capricolum subsp. capricolum]
MKKLLMILGVSSFLFIGFTGFVLSNEHNNSNKYGVYYKQLKSTNHKIDKDGRLTEIGYTVLSNGVVQIKNIDYRVKIVAAQLPDEITSLKGAFQVNPHNVRWEVDWNTKNITDMSYAFYNTTWFDSEKISKWNTSKVTNMEGMFGLAKSFDQDLSEWDVSKVVNFKDMFNGAEKFNNKGKSLNWNSKLKSAKNMQGMFKSTDLFDQDISDWNLSNVTNISQMFSGSKSFNKDISKWDVSNVKDMSKLFENAYAFNNGEKPLDWEHKLKSIENVSYMFNGANNFKHNLNKWIIKKSVKHEKFGLDEKIQPTWKSEVIQPIIPEKSEIKPEKQTDQVPKYDAVPNPSPLPVDMPNNSESSIIPKKPEHSEISDKTTEKNEIRKEEKVENPKSDNNLYKIPTAGSNTIIKPSSANAGIITGAVLGGFTILGTGAGLGYYYRKNLKNLYLKSADKLKPSLLKSKDNIKDFYAKSIDKTKNLYFKSKNKIKDKIAKIKSKK